MSAPTQERSAICRTCLDGVLPFPNTVERQTWAEAHARGTGHEVVLLPAALEEQVAEEPAAALPVVNDPERHDAQVVTPDGDQAHDPDPAPEVTSG